MMLTLKKLVLAKFRCPQKNNLSVKWTQTNQSTTENGKIIHFKKQTTSLRANSSKLSLITSSIETAFVAALAALTTLQSHLVAKILLCKSIGLSPVEQYMNTLCSPRVQPRGTAMLLFVFLSFSSNLFISCSSKLWNNHYLLNHWR